MPSELRSFEDHGELNRVQRLIYSLRLDAERLRREVYELNEFESPPSTIDELITAEKELAQAEAKLASLVSQDQNSGLVMSLEQGGVSDAMMGETTTGLQVRMHLRMAQVPTAIYHLLDPKTNPLLTCTVRNYSYETRRVRVTAQIEGYSAQAILTAEVSEVNEVEVEEANGEDGFSLSPTLFPEKIGHLSELTRATLNVLVEDLDNLKVEEHTTYPIWLLARTTAPLAVRDPKTGFYQDLSQFLGAFVTPNAPCLMSFLRQAVDAHPQKRLVGYQGNAAIVESQVKALFQALKEKGNIKYVNSVIAFNPDQGSANQRVRLPKQSLGDRQANCLDGTVLFASLLEGISLSPAIALVPGHAFVAWETWKDSGKWAYLETTLIGSSSFEDARSQGEAQAVRYQALAQATENSSAFRLLPLRQLRAEQKITPME